MSVKIKKHYSRNINLGNYQTLRIGLDIEKEIADESEIEETSIALLKIASKQVNKELRKIKEKMCDKSV